MTEALRILVVDDDRLVLAIVSEGLRQAGFAVVDVDNGDDAILEARQRRPDLALLDIRMEGKTGFDVGEYLRDVLHVPFMFLSAFSDDATRARAAALGAVDYLVKPVDVPRLVRQVRDVLASLPAGPGAPARPAEPPPGAAESALPDAVGLAVGILMHRYSLDRSQAWQRLQRLAAERGESPAAQADRLVTAVEELSRGGE